MLKSFALSLSAAFFIEKKNKFQTAEPQQTRNAVSILYPHANSGVYGLVSFSQENVISSTKIVANIKGLKPNSLHGFHIHEFGDLTDGCTTAGGHFNPTGQTHGGPLDLKRHVGDLGNLRTDENGNAYVAMSDKQITLFGDNSVVGRSCVVHQNQDDLGKGGHADSHTTGNSGPRVACGVIGLSKEFKNLAPK